MTNITVGNVLNIVGTGQTSTYTFPIDADNIYSRFCFDDEYIYIVNMLPNNYGLTLHENSNCCRFKLDLSSGNLMNLPTNGQAGYGYVPIALHIVDSAHIYIVSDDYGNGFHPTVTLWNASAVHEYDWTFNTTYDTTAEYQSATTLDASGKLIHSDIDVTEGRYVVRKQDPADMSTAPDWEISYTSPYSALPWYLAHNSLIIKGRFS